MQRLLDHAIRQRRDAQCPRSALRLGDIHPAPGVRHVLPRQQFGLDRRPVLLEVVVELGDTDAIDAGSTFVLDHPLIGEFQVVAFAHGVQQPACPLPLRFGPRPGRHVSLGAAQSPLGVLPRFLLAGIRLPRIFCLHRLSVWSRRLLAAFNVRPFSSYGHLLWPLLTSAWASRHLSMSVARRFPSAPLQISPGMTHPPSRLCLSDIRHGVPYKFRASQIFACSPRRAASYPLPVRQASALPSASSRFPVAQNTLAVQLTLPLVGRVEDFHLQVSAPCRAHKEKKRRRGGAFPTATAYEA